ncbi:hypothetical protein EDD85DRAFT_796166 [Armillaria nabsnona]|nr:hypothetical protein EDD85DRAFT_796166 [Armillaria nabsnona]
MISQSCTSPACIPFLCSYGIIIVSLTPVLVFPTLEWWIRNFECCKNSNIQRVTFHVCYNAEYVPTDDYSIWRKLDKVCAAMGSLRSLEIVVMLDNDVDKDNHIILALRMCAIEDQLTLSIQHNIVSEWGVSMNILWGIEITLKEGKAIKMGSSSDMLVTMYKEYRLRVSSQAVASKSWYLVEHVRGRDSCSSLAAPLYEPLQLHVSNQSAPSQNQEDCPSRTPPDGKTKNISGCG